MPHLRREVERFFDSLDEAYPNTPRRCFTGLASGADQLIAAIAIRLGIAVTVVLPALPEAFRSSLDSQSDRETFDDLFKKAFDVIILPNIATSAEVAESPVSIHDKQYAALGNFLSDRSEILLALFDGKALQEKLGGTAWIVRRKKEGRDRAGAEWLDLPQTGLVYSIPVRRKADEAWPDDEPRYQLCEGEKLSTYQAAFREIDLFNKRARDISVTRLHSLQNAANELDRVQLIADLLAVKWKEKITLSRRTLFACAVVMFFSYLAYANFIPTLPLIVLYLSAQTVGATIWFMQRSSRAHKNYVMYRTFCEALRVLQAWRDGGIKESSFRHFQRKHYSHLRWIRLAVRVETAAAI